MNRARPAALVLAALVLAALASLVGCGTATRTGAPVAPATPAAAEQLRFTAKTVDGAEFSGQSLAGKPAVLWFWAPWCPICQGEAPGIADAAHTHPQVSFVGVAGLDQPPAMHEFVARYRLGSFPHLADVDGAVWKRFGVTQQPAYAFIHPDGTVQVEKRPLTEQELAARLTTLAGT